MIVEAHRGSHWLQKAPRGSLRLPEAPRGSQKLPEASVLRELGLSSSYVDGSGYRVLALLIDPPRTTIGPEGGWGLPHTFAKICILIKNAKKNRLGDPKPFFLTHIR
jgi:hypothetical protein